MRSLSRLLYINIFTIIVVLAASCSISYGFKGGTIDYTQIKTISIPNVQNRASLVYPPLASKFTQELQDYYAQRTKLEQVNRDGDLDLVCEIIGYDLSPMSIGQDNFASRTQFVMQVKVKYTNNINEKESFDKTFRVQRDFGRDQQFNSIQDEMVESMIEELIKQIFNATIENW